MELSKSDTIILTKNPKEVTIDDIPASEISSEAGEVEGFALGSLDGTDAINEN